MSFGLGAEASEAPRARAAGAGRASELAAGGGSAGPATAAGGAAAKKPKRVCRRVAKGNRGRGKASRNRCIRQVKGHRKPAP